MTYWTILIITYGASFIDGGKSYVVLPGQQHCEEYMDDLFTLLQPKFPNLMIQCQETERPSITVRPKQRPEGLAHD
jgi:hypothetical protein